MCWGPKVLSLYSDSKRGLEESRHLSQARVRGESIFVALTVERVKERLHIKKSSSDICATACKEGELTFHGYLIYKN